MDKHSHIQLSLEKGKLSLCVKTDTPTPNPEVKGNAAGGKWTQPLSLESLFLIAFLIYFDLLELICNSDWQSALGKGASKFKIQFYFISRNAY